MPRAASVVIKRPIPSLYSPAFLATVALNAVRQFQHEPAGYSDTSIASSTTSASCSMTPKSKAPHTPRPKSHMNPPSPRPYSFVTAEGYIIEEFPRSKCISEPSRPRHRRFHSTPNASSSGRSNPLGAHKSHPSTTTRGHSVHRSSPLASPPSPPAPITNAEFPYFTDSTTSPDSPQILPTSPPPIWPSSPRGTTPVKKSLKLKKRRPARIVKDKPVCPSFCGTPSIQPILREFTLKYLRLSKNI